MRGSSRPALKVGKKRIGKMPGSIQCFQPPKFHGQELQPIREWTMVLFGSEHSALNLEEFQLGTYSDSYGTGPGGFRVVQLGAKIYF
jgi:hypothetical protein